MAFPVMSISYAHALGVEHSYIMAGVPNSYAHPLGKVHKSGHAILCALSDMLSVIENENRKSNYI